MNDYNFGNFVCTLREKKGLTQVEIADMLGVTAAAVSKWENGSSKPRVDVLFRLAEILGVRTEELIAGKHLPNEDLDSETVKVINERYEYLCKIDSFSSTSVKLRRIAASLFDFIIAMGGMYLLTLLTYKLVRLITTDSGIEAVCCVLCVMISYTVLFGMRDIVGFGRSLGKRIMCLTILDKKTGERARFRQRLLRDITAVASVVCVSAFILGVDVVIMLIIGRSVGDCLANTVVVSGKKPKNRNSNVATQKNPKEDPANKDGVEKHTLEEQIGLNAIRNINSYKSPSGPSIKFIVILFSVIAAVILSAIVFLVVYFVKYDEYDEVSTDIAGYDQDISDICNASDFMPSISSLGAYEDIRYSYKVYVYSSYLNFVSNGWALFVQYSDSEYEAKKADLLSKNVYLTKPVTSGERYELPLTEFQYKGYNMKIIPDEDYIDYCACKSFALVGFDDENKRIVYLYHYDFDIDYIAEADEDLEKEMHRFMDSVFVWNDFE